MSLWVLNTAGVEITINLKSPESHDLLQSLVSDMGAQPVKRSKGAVLRVAGRAGKWQLHDKAADIDRTLKLEGDLIYHLTDRVVFHVANNADGVHCIHAAAVSYQGGVIIVPANSGAGKSTFTAWLVANGFKYVTDELILISADMSVQGIARPIQIKANGIDAIRNLLRNSEYFEGSLANAIAPQCLGGEMAEPGGNRLAAFVFPQYTKGSQCEFSELSSAAAGLQLMNNHVNARNLEDHGFRTMMALVRSTPRYELNYGGFDTLPDDFANRLKGICQATT